MKSAKTVTFLFLTILLLAACQNAQEFDDSEMPEDQVEEVDDNNSPEMQESPEDQPTDGESQAKDKLEEYLNMRPAFKATYDVSNEVQGEVQEGEETVVIKGNNSKRSYAEESFYVLQDKVYLCQDDECWDIPQEEPPTEIDTSIPENTTVSEAPARTVAGTPTECFAISGNGEEVIDCRTENGVLAYFARTAPNYNLEMTATSIKNEVSDSEFELPSEPKEFNPEDFQNTQVSN